MAEPAEPVEQLLKRLRNDAGLTQIQVGERLNRNQPWISRFERGDRVPTRQDAELLIELYQPAPEDRRRLLALSRDLLEEATPSLRVVIKRGAERMQERIHRIEESSRRIATFAAVVVPGLLQTEAYARAVFASGGDLPPEQQADSTAARMRRQELLRTRGREFVFVLAEGVARWPLGGPQVMAEQLDRIIERSRLPRVRVGVVPGSGSVDIAPMHAFDVHDQRAAIVGTETATAFLTNPHDVAAYVKLFANLERLAVYGDEARILLGEIADHYRQR